MAKRQKPDLLKEFKYDDQRRRTAIWQETCQVVRDLGRYFRNRLQSSEYSGETDL